MAWNSDHRRPTRRVGPNADRLRHHGSDQPFDRRELERSGWRTSLEYRENLVRGRDGMLGAVECEWYAEAERVGLGGEIVVASATGSTPATVWRRLRAQADLEPVRQRRRELQRR